MVLSIGMIVKNEEKYLERCLSALKPILENVESELIIADTGSTDRTVDIAKKFTSNVFYFQWCDDYAKARNSTIERSSGEWYMFVDADEILENPDELINFFNSGEYKEYEYATYIQRNLSGENDNSIYSDFYPIRLVKITDKTYFEHSIHEKLYYTGNIRKHINAVFLHYGYISGRASVKKTKKYISAIKKDLDNNLGDLRQINHITDAYTADNDIYKAIKTIYISLTLTDIEFYNLISIYKLVKLYNKIKDYKSLLNIINKLFPESKNNIINIYDPELNALFTIRDYQAYNEAFNYYDEAYKDATENGFNAKSGLYLSLHTYKGYYFANLVMNILSDVYLKNFGSAEKNIDIYIPLNKLHFYK